MMHFDFQFDFRFFISNSCISQVFLAVIRWLESSRESRETEFHRVLAHVRLPLISPYFLHDFVENSR